MKPQNDQPVTRVGTTYADQSRAHIVAAPRQTPSAHHAAADVVRNQLDHIYAGGSGEQTPHTTPVAAQPAPTTPAVEPGPSSSDTPIERSPMIRHGFSTAPPEEATKPAPAQTTADQEISAYQRTMAVGTSARQPSKEDWQQYHSAWQKYYQMYYERQSALQQHAAHAASTTPSDETSRHTTKEETITQKEAMNELRASIRGKVAASAAKVRTSRHFIPALAGVVVLLIFVGLQFNRQIVGTVLAYTTPGNIEPQNIIVDTTAQEDVGPEPKMIIPKLNIDAPVVYGIGPDYNSQMAAMERGIAHFSIPGANAVPGQVGNAVFAAHSSNDVFARGDYKFIFAQNEKLIKGDIIHMNYEGKRYTYAVTTTEVVMPNEVSKVQIDTKKPMLTLISCVPLGTAEKRLLVFAEQIYPDSSEAEAAETDDASTPEATNIPGKPAPTLLERLFGAR